jgi:hypothetical protein
MSTEPDVDKNAIAENVQRTVERAALRKVRKLVDKIEEEQAVEQRHGNRAMIAFAVIVVLFLAWLIANAINDDRQLNRDQKFQVPETVAVPKKG